LRRGSKGRHGGKGGIALCGSKERMAAVIWGLQAQAPAPRPGVYGRKSLGVCVNDLPGERDGVLVGKEEDVGGFRICHIYELRVSTRCRRRGWGWGGMESIIYLCLTAGTWKMLRSGTSHIYTAARVEEPATKNGGARKEGFDTGARAATLLKSWIGDEE